MFNNPKPTTKPIHQKVGHGTIRSDAHALIVDVRRSGFAVVESAYTVAWAAQVAEECEALLNYWGAECRRFAALRCDDKILIMDDRYHA